MMKYLLPLLLLCSACSSPQYIVTKRDGQTRTYDEVYIHASNTSLLIGGNFRVTTEDGDKLIPKDLDGIKYLKVVDPPEEKENPNESDIVRMIRRAQSRVDTVYQLEITRDTGTTIRGIILRSDLENLTGQNDDGEDTHSFGVIRSIFRK